MTVSRLGTPPGPCPSIPSHEPAQERVRTQRSPAAAVRSDPAPARSTFGVQEANHKSGSAAVSLQTMRFGEGPEILIPSTDRNARRTLQRYLDALEKNASFDWGKHPLGERIGQDGIRALRTMTPTFSSGAPDPRPVVGVLTSMPEMLIPGESGMAAEVVRCVERMGCRPVIIPPLADALVEGPQRSKVLSQMVRLFDGVVGAGGKDLDPSTYGESHGLSSQTNPKVDAFELRFIREAMGKECFLFGICRSHQLWNVARGAKLVPDLQKYGLSAFQNQGKFGIAREKPLVLSAPDAEGANDPTKRFKHLVYLKPGSRVSKAAKREAMVTNAFNHQAVDANRPAKGLQITALTVDPITQQPLVSGTEDWQTITVQFHPEVMKTDAARSLLETAARRAHIFRAAKQLRAEGEPLDSAAVRQRMEKLPVRFEKSDHEWLERDLAPRLRNLPVNWSEL